ncbi:hypothetical protein Ae168Ps1_3548 [Pseudonocardia sp. Ae168_Ps1]|nr:hypothetical protein Ae150APs1_3526 [Pseudonocardia sp. Ae150A_Ps1]OLL81142.1 hypothetical protein Ae168Ps1_3548 [Pseudonocardia sp. Ae168_Ps1]OLL84743.1 hypothetical protein Ae263Ps1_1798c [Pseudonocardia sp. Ae263_Ps1]OLL95240.1 hypothetical protein Ae356Ps1_5137 [Pseudonocardia sp. Ae356_Ps1]
MTYTMGLPCRYDLPRRTRLGREKGMAHTGRRGRRHPAAAGVVTRH